MTRGLRPSSGPGTGGYAGWTKGRVFVDGLIKADWYDVQANMGAITSGRQTFSGDTLGAKGEAGYRLVAKNKIYFEPVVDVAWTSTHLLDADFAGQDAKFAYGNATSLRGSIGARAGGQLGPVRPYLGVYVGQEFSGGNRMTMLTGVTEQCGASCDLTLQDQKPGGFTRVDFGVTGATSWKGFNWYLKGQSDVGASSSGGSGQLGVRWRW